MSVVIGIVFLTALGFLLLADRLPARGAGAGRTPGGPRRRQAAIAFLLAAAGIALQLAGSAAWADVALDWLPGVYLLAAYWLPAQLSHRSAPGLQARLEAADRAFFAAGFARFLDRAPRAFLEYLEAAYLFCYAIVPGALAWLYFTGHRREADAFWTAVLLAVLPCYLLVAFFETQPPRNIETRPLARPRPLAVRRLNLAVLDRVSIGLNTFPSGHAAAAIASALAVAAAMPAPGVVLGVLAVSIAVGSVAGRYHYALDAATGALTALAAFAVSRMV